MAENEFIQIQSKTTITVTPGLQAQDVTNPDAHVPDRLKVNARWPKATIRINEGVGTYPAFIREWPTVQALVNDKIITISDSVVEVSDEARKVADELTSTMKAEQIEVKTTKKYGAKKSLNDIAGE